MEDAIFTEEDKQALLEAFVFIPTAKTVRFKISDVAPITMVKVKTINKIQVDRPLLCLLDTVSTGTMIRPKCIFREENTNKSVDTLRLVLDW